MFASKRSTSLRPFVVLFAFALLLLVPVMTAVAQIDPVRTSPTQAPTATMGALQANPTQPPEPDPIDDIQANPTNTPTPRPPDGPDDVVANPTDAPRGPDDVVANPTREPETVIDDFQANPTKAPEPVIDDLQANPTESGTLTVRKWVCPAFYDPLAGSPLDDCAESLDGITFELDNHDPGQPDLLAVTGDVIDGAAFFEPEPGTYSLAEQIPDGYEQPFLWDCTGLNNAAAMGPLSTINFYRIVIGPGQDIGCDWMNVVDNDNHIVRVHAYACPEGVNPSDSYWTTSTECVDPMEGVAFSLTTDGGMGDGLTDAGGRFLWTDVDLGDSGEIQIVESIPAGYGEPEVWCVSSPVFAGDAQDYEFFQVQAVDGLVTASPAQHEPYRFSCFFFNDGEGGVGAIDDVLVANPTEAPETVIDDLQANPTVVPGIDDIVANPGAGTVRVMKRDCPLGVVEDAVLSEYLVICTESHNGVEFTLDHAGGSEAAVTAAGEAVWTGVTLGAFAIQETLPPGYGDPIVFCGFTESPGGGVQHPSLKPSAGGLVTGALVQFGSEYACSWMNVPSDPDNVIDDLQANPTGTANDPDHASEDRNPSNVAGAFRSR
ncbi:MAG: hypothetical protein H0V37_09320 [Chloroflexia bacterium]|nr:hypothetical protein [Chloroflexia bacterium]